MRTADLPTSDGNCSLGDCGGKENRLSAYGLTKPLCNKFAESDRHQRLPTFGSLWGFAAAPVIHRLGVNQPFVRPVWLDRSRPVPESRRFDRGFDLRPTTHPEGKGR